MLYDAHPAAYCVTDSATASRCPVQPPSLPRNLNPGSKPKKSARDSPKPPAQNASRPSCAGSPNLPERIFSQSMQTSVTDETVTWKELYLGKVKKSEYHRQSCCASVGTYGRHRWGDSDLKIRRLNEENVYSRAYIAFRTEELVVVTRFSRDYDGHIFKHKAGLSFRHLFSVLELKMMRSGLIHKGNEAQAVVISGATTREEKGRQ